MKWWPLSAPRTERERRFAFLLPPIVWAVFAALAPLPVLNRLALGDEVMPIVALAGMVGGSFGLVQVDWRAPDDFGGWGRVAALWLGFVLLLPGAAAWGLRFDPPQIATVALAAAWVIFSALPFGRWETLNGRQCLGFSLRFYGVWLGVMLVVVFLTPDQGGWVLAVAYLASPVFAAWARKRLPDRPVATQLPYPAARLRRFFAILAPLLALACYDFWSTFGGKAQPHFGGLLELAGIQPFPGIGVVGFVVVQVLPFLILLTWMRDGLSLKGWRDARDLSPYALMATVLSTGSVWMAFALIGQASKWFFHPWMDDYPVTALMTVMILTVTSGLFWYRLLLGMDVMAVRQGKAP